MSKQLSTKQYVHSVYFEREGSDGQLHNYTVINEKDSKTNKSTLRYIKDYERPVWVTKEHLRNHTFKKEYAPITELDEYRAKEHEKWDAVFEILHGFKSRRPMTRRNTKSPFIYGVDIESSVLLKTKYLDANDDSYPEITFGGLDIETSMFGGREVIIATYVDCSWKVYTGVYKPFLKRPDSDEYYTYDEVKAVCKEKLIKHLDSYNLNRPNGTVELTYEMLDIEIKIFDNELDVIKFAIKGIHECKPDLCGIWNMDFDIPHFIERIEFLGGSLTDILCHPEVPEEFRFVKYVPDRRQVDHITLFWHNCYISGYTRFVDSMCLYSRKRTVEGRDIKYGLDYISNKELNIGKLTMDNEITYHPYLQKYKFLDYIAYNICDSLPIVLMEYKNGDLKTLVATTDNSLIEHYAFQSIRLTNTMFRTCLSIKHITCSADALMKTEFCSLIPSTGGLVLDPKLTRNTSVPIFKDYDQQYGFIKSVSDIDATAIYPTISEICNLGKETKISTCLEITGKSKYLIEAEQRILSISEDDKDKDKKIKEIKGEVIHNLFLQFIASKENAVSIASEYFGLANYDEIMNVYNEIKGNTHDNNFTFA